LKVKPTFTIWVLIVKAILHVYSRTAKHEHIIKMPYKGGYCILASFPTYLPPYIPHVLQVDYIVITNWKCG
jgi:hypothetical protein